jgi:hypothetical protein
MRKLYIAIVIGAAGLSCAAPAASSMGIGADEIFSRAKSAWRERAEAPFVQFSLRERYSWRSRTHDNWWQVAYRSGDRALALHRQIVAEQEDARLRGTPIALNFKFHRGLGRADSVDTNADADAFPILDPQIEPDASFGLQRSGPKVALVGALSPSALPSASPGSASASPEPSSLEGPAPDATPLRVLVTVEAASRDYSIALADTETLHGTDAYHLTLTPLRDPHVYRLRDLWVDATTFETLQLSVAGLFDGEPYRSARWIVSYVDVGGRPFIQQIRTDDQLRFGLDRYVSGLQYDFVQYSFPPALPDMTFERYL